jgi:hypothetical protein
MFKPLPADPALIQKLRIRNRVASPVCFGLFIGFPIVNSFIAIPVSNSTDYEAIANYSALMLVIGFANAALMIPASVFFFTHALRYKKLLAYLGTNPAEANRISKLSPFLQAKEIGRIEAQVAVNPVVKRTTSAPAPITPVTARASGSPSYDTTDPRSTKTMSTSEWIEAERRRQIKKQQAQMNR